MRKSEARKQAKEYMRAWSWAEKGKLEKATGIADIDLEAYPTENDIISYCEDCIFDLEKEYGVLIK